MDPILFFACLTLLHQQFYLTSSKFTKFNFMKPTYRPSKIKRARKFGFRARNATWPKFGARRAKGRKRLAA